MKNRTCYFNKNDKGFHKEINRSFLVFSMYIRVTWHYGACENNSRTMDYTSCGRNINNQPSSIM